MGNNHVCSLVPRSAHIQAKISLVWVKITSALHGRLSFNIIREICQFLGFRPLLLACGKSQIYKFDPVEEQFQVISFKQLALRLTYETSCTSACIGDDQIFLCGGTLSYRETSPRAFLINSNRATQLADMCIGRYAHGLYYDEAHKYVFAFGGRDWSRNDINYCEEYSIARNSWSPLPSMSTKSMCTQPCGCHGKVYVGLCRKNYIEVFTIATKKFDRLQIPLCLDFTYPIIWKTQLILFQEDKVLKFDSQTHAFISQSACPKKLYLPCRLVYNDILFSLNATGCIAYSLETLELVRIVTDR